MKYLLHYFVYYFENVGFLDVYKGIILNYY